jgi:competence protein ComEC
MGAGIDLMVATGKEVASWPGAVSILPQISGTALVLIVLGMVWICLWQTRLRALGLVIAAAGLVLAPQANRPDVLIERQGATTAIRSESGNLVFPPATAASYSTDNWLLADGDERDITAASDEGTFRCDSLGCIGTVKGKTWRLSAILPRSKRTAESPRSSSPRSPSVNAVPRASSSTGAC